LKILTVISNFNEEKSIERCLLDFNENATIESDLLVIDNASTDQSINLIKKRKVAFLQHPVNTGGSSGVIKTALLYSCMYEYDVYCHLDGDCQHNADELATLIQPIIDKKANIVVGSRFLHKKGFQSFFIRRLGIFSYSYIVSRIAGQKITDLTSGFRAYDKKAIRFFAKQYQHEFDPCIQMLLIASFAGLILKEVPVRMNPRCAGRSEIGIIQAFKFPILGAMHIIGIILQKNNIRRLRCS